MAEYFEGEKSARGDLAQRQICQLVQVSVLHPLWVFASQLEGPEVALRSSLQPNISTLPAFTLLLVCQNRLGGCGHAGSFQNVPGPFGQFS